MSWINTTLEKVTHRIRNGLNVKQYSDAGGLPITRIESISNQIIDNSKAGFANIKNGEKSNWYLQKGEILFSHINSEDRIGNCALYEGHPKPLVHGMNLLSLMPNEKVISPKYLLYCIRSPHFRISLKPIIKRAVNQASVSIGNLKDIKISLPTLSEQRRIVEILDQADALRKKRAEADKKAERILPTLFYKMFGDPATNPMGWPTKSLDKLFKFTGGGTPSKSNDEFWKGKIPWVSPKDMKVEIINDTKDHISEEAIKQSSVNLIKRNSVLVVYRSGILVHSFPVALAGVDLTINQDLKALSSKGEVSNFYLFGWLTSAKSLVMSCIKKGATVHNVDGNKFKNLKVMAPNDNSLLDSFDKQLETILGLKFRREIIQKNINTLFNVIVHRAFSGDLTARWRQSNLKELLAEMEEQAKLLESPPKEKVPEVKTKKHSGFTMYNKAALAAYITGVCHSSQNPMGRVKLAKLFYLAQRKTGLGLTEAFAQRAAGPLDDDIHKFLNLGMKQKWVKLAKAQGDFKPVYPGPELPKATSQVKKKFGPKMAVLDDTLEKLKDWSWEKLEVLATVDYAMGEIRTKGQNITASSIRTYLSQISEWKEKLNKPHFSNPCLEEALMTLQELGFTH